MLAPYYAWQEVRKLGRNHNYVMFNRGTVWTQNGITLTAVKAEHSDLTAIGFIVDDSKETSRSITKIFCRFAQDIDTVFLPINGVGNNMNITDAKRFAVKTGAKMQYLFIGECLTSLTN